MGLIALIEKQYFIVNLENVDIADAMISGEEKTEEEIESEDVDRLKRLLNEEGIALNTLNGQEAEIVFDMHERALFIELNNKIYKLSMLEFLGYDKYKKITNYFLQKTSVILKNPSEQIGGIIDKNYGFKFMISL